MAKAKFPVVGCCIGLVIGSAGIAGPKLYKQYFGDEAEIRSYIRLVGKSYAEKPDAVVPTLQDVDWPTVTATLLEEAKAESRYESEIAPLRMRWLTKRSSDVEHAALEQRISGLEKEESDKINDVWKACGALCLRSQIHIHEGKLVVGSVTLMSEQTRTVPLKNGGHEIVTMDYTTKVVSKNSDNIFYGNVEYDVSRDIEVKDCKTVTIAVPGKDLGGVLYFSLRCSKPYTLKVPEQREAISKWIAEYQKITALTVG